MNIVEQLDLTPYNSYRIQATCARAFFPDSEEDIREIYTTYKAGKKIVLGSGHNVILSKDHYKDDFVLFSGNFQSVFQYDEGSLEAESGITMLALSELAAEHSLTGLEMFYDIPSSLGGAVVMNAGASGEEIKDLLVKVRYYDPFRDEFNEINRADISFEYRNSFFQLNPHLIITKVWLQLAPGDPVAIRNKMEETKKARWAKQPKEYPNAGSVFKRPKGFYVGAMMDELNLKGFTIGGAQISKKHGGFIVNFNNASGSDILSIISSVQAKVKEKYSVDLEIEQRVI